ncbi:NAD(P)H-hydrate dehydratase [Candidatus Beckwithbacteria bacterium CG10_big_fil_rev_8_21_14_0_10_34_10]|uniref:ADP-dependent (S)-NAD(P)H-hydrate dehydratase n=1 Tax=Candidatus Beckwithbacteria bacterium CG10_big_fil_rev_8_21_14_0_10_34_10 TaxID=1974495 RepID=A0A2H0W892_9BACT|nr:MAG: NAD(P)H-hydrate dehydratase [Candidatus Beckwithbacteria bacterium CG10_big_fil_rev_8_21_14_0_10_34_10]
MKTIGPEIISKLFLPPKNSHKGQNGKLTLIGGSSLFHGASLWALKTASRIVDMVFYATIKENQALTKKLNSNLYDFICIPEGKIDDYIKESDVVLIGSGLMRELETNIITKKLLNKYPHKKWVIDAGSLQMIKAQDLKDLTQVIITPHKKEFINLFNLKETNPAFVIQEKASQYTCTIVLKGEVDLVCSEKECVLNKTGNEGMTKGGTGDVLAGLIAALACKNDLFLAAAAGIYLNGLAGDKLYKKVGPFFNASDLCDQLPKTIWSLIEQNKR